MIPIFVIYLLAFFIPLILTALIMPFHIKLMLKKGVYGVDIHKKEQPKVAERGGIVFLISIAITLFILYFLLSDKNDKISLLIFGLTLLIAGVVGIIDDFITLNAIVKPLLLLLASLPIIISGFYIPYPMLPFIGKTRLTIVYLILLPFAISITANAVNMLDVFNGSMASTVSIVLVTAAIADTIIFGFNYNRIKITDVFILITLGILIAFWVYNRYPAKVFAGDTGSLTIGAALGVIAIMGHLEVIMIIAMIPFIMNSFGIISSLKGLVERHNMPAKATLMTENWELKANPNEKAPITLTGLILQEGPLKEVDVVRSFNILTIVSAILAITTAVLIKIYL